MVVKIPTKRGNKHDRLMRRFAILHLLGLELMG
jgi:hypothetical protein